MKFFKQEDTNPSVRLKEMVVGDVFQWNGKLCMCVTRNGHPAFIDLATGHDIKESNTVHDYDIVYPVECTLCWSFKKR